jgi:hypothetical protein
LVASVRHWRRILRPRWGVWTREGDVTLLRSIEMQQASSIAISGRSVKV